MCDGASYPDTLRPLEPELRHRETHESCETVERSTLLRFFKVRSAPFLFYYCGTYSTKKGS